MCAVNGVAGDGTTQGTCASSTDVCTSTGECLGNLIIITNTIILQLVMVALIIPYHGS